MNLVDGFVTEIIGKPYFEYGVWWQKVKYDSYGIISETALYEKYIETLDKIEIGYKFLT